jgi:hypothetical protein
MSQARGRASALPLALLVAALGCGRDDPPPPSLVAGMAPPLLFVVHNELWRIRLDGTGRRSLGTVGDDRHRTGWPRFLPDGRAALLADDTGAIFPWVGPRGDGTFERLPQMNVTLNDSLCGVTVAGASRLVFTTTPFLPTRTTVERMDPDQPALEPVGFEPDGVISNPAPYDDGRVLVIRTVRGAAKVELLDVSGAAYRSGQSQVLAQVPEPYQATSPARLPDGRVVFIRVDPRDVTDTAVGEMFVIEVDGTVHTTGATGVLALEVIGDQVIYEEGGATQVSDLIQTDLVNPPVNITNTPFISEHLDWSD